MIKIKKVIVSVSLKELMEDKNLLEKASETLSLITGQKPKICRAKKAIADFKLRIGVPIGLMVTLRRQKMNDFLTKLFQIVLPRVKDFQGLSTDSFDRQGNYTLGLEEQIVFSEVDSAKIDKIHGLEITIVTNSQDQEEAKKLLVSKGALFKEKDGQKE